MKIEDILSGGYKRKTQRGPRQARHKSVELVPAELHEGGNIFPDAVPFDHAKIPQILKQVNSVLATAGAKAYPIGSGATPTPGKTSGDLDMIVDADTLINHFQSPDLKTARKSLRSLFDEAGLQTGQSGVSVHVLIPVGNEAHQVDIMVVANAETAQKFHVHNIPQGSKYKGVHKQIAMAKLAKAKNMLWSPYEGLWQRGPDGKKSEFYTNDIDKVAQTLLGAGATREDLGSFDSILAALGPEKAKQLVADLQTDPSWKEPQ